MRESLGFKAGSQLKKHTALKTEKTNITLGFSESRGEMLDRTLQGLNPLKSFGGLGF